MELVDEYDKPILDVLDVNVELEEPSPERTGSVFIPYSKVPTNAFTGVMKFSQVSVSGGFNHPDDISLDVWYGCALRHYVGRTGIPFQFFLPDYESSEYLFLGERYHRRVDLYLRNPFLQHFLHHDQLPASEYQGQQA